MTGDARQAPSRRRISPLETMFAAISTPMWIYDEETLEFVEANPAASDLYGYEHTELLQMRLRDIEPASQTRPPVGRRESDHLTRQGRFVEVEVQSERTIWKGRAARLDMITDLTGQKESERQLASAQSLIASVVSTTRMAILTIDEELRITSMNPAACRLFRVEEDGAAVGSNLERFIPRPYREEYGAQLIASGISATIEQPYTMEMLLKRADGDAFVGEASVAQGENGGRRFIALMLRDTTEQRQAEAVLRDSERRYHLLASIAPVGIFRLDGEGRCLYMNEKLCSMTDREADAVIGHGWQNAVHPDDRQVVIDEWESALRERRAFNAEVRLVSRSGATTWVLISAHTEQDEDGCIRSYVGTMININRRKTAEEALRKSEQMYRDLASVAPIGLFRADVQGGVTFLNDRASAITGWRPSRMLGERWVDVVDPEDRCRVTKTWRDSIASGTPIQHEFHVTRQDGTRVLVRASAVPERDERGRITGFVGTVMEIGG